jgi:hypothetical protein
MNITDTDTNVNKDFERWLELMDAEDDACERDWEYESEVRAAREAEAAAERYWSGRTNPSLVWNISIMMMQQSHHNDKHNPSHQQST